MRFSNPTLPVTHVRPAGKPDVRLTILVSFAAGILLGVPLTFGALFLGTLETSSAPVVISQSGHPAGSRFPATEKSGLAAALESRRKKTSPRDIPVTLRRTGDNSWNFLKSASDDPVTLRHPSDSVLVTLRPPSDNAPIKLRHSRDNDSLRHPSGDSESLQNGRLFDGVFWTELAESQVPKGFGEESATQWREFLNATEVVKVEEGCGRMQNRRVTLSDGRTSCCRYRYNNDQIQGEIFSFYVGRLLAIDNLSPSALSLVDPRTRKWSRAASQMALARWSPDRPAVLTQFIPDLQPAYVPVQLRDSLTRAFHPVSDQLRRDQISELVQWSDLVVFDYLTANLDRVVNNMYNERWNPGMMSQPTHNLAKTPDGLLVFLDNESGLLHGYRLLDKYEHFHRALLDATCVFRKGTIARIERLLSSADIGALLRAEFEGRDPGMSDWLPFLPDRSVRTLRERLVRVMEQVRKCKARFESTTGS